MTTDQTPDLNKEEKVMSLLYARAREYEKMRANIPVNRLYTAIQALREHIDGRVNPKFTVIGLTLIKNFLEEYVPERWDDKLQKWVEQDFPKVEE